MSEPDPLVFYNLAADVLHAAEVAVVKTEAGLPRDANVCVVPFITEIDCCNVDLLTAVTSVYSSSSFPSQDSKLSPCGIGPIAVVVIVAIRRCVPVTGVNATDLPTCADLAAAAKIQNTDAWAVRRGIACFFAQQNDVDVAIGATTMVNDGRCSGSNLPVTIGYNDVCNCDGLSLGPEPTLTHFYDDSYDGSY